MSLTEIWLRLIKVNDLYGDRMQNIADALMNEATVTLKNLRDVGLTAKQAARFFSVTEQEVAEGQHWLSQPENHLLLADSPLYPHALRAISDYPTALFVRGNLSLLSSYQLAVVGSRNISWYGERWGSAFCEVLAQREVTITSGLAIGVDAVAHRSALRVAGKTIAVLGSGLNHIYPHRHRQLAEDIVASGGALVSEFPLSMTPFPHNFPRRNRIISGLSRGVLVVEAALKSGSLVTARCALEQGRDVYAIPGPLGSPGSEGPHWLIQQGAIMVTTPDDILENRPIELFQHSDAQDTSKYSTDQDSVALPFPELLANVGDEVTPVDVVAERAGQPVPVTVAQLLELELAGWIAAVPGGYVRLRRACHVRRTTVLV
ncbi:DNA-protecting protein DprA [Pseudocitrobacter cyperus]|uniref:DNA-protecting protein DprA n=1 Tax=Pseudocitrobacter cyperus TaxID=3112843 RepID=A0ABV0HSR8_9ENTR